MFHHLLPGWFLDQSIIIYTAGIKLFLHLNVQKQWPPEGSVVTCLVVCFAAVILIGEVFYRLVEYPSRALAYRRSTGLENRRSRFLSPLCGVG